MFFSLLDAIIVSPLLQQLISIVADEVKQQVRLVTGIRQEVLPTDLQAVQVVLEDAEQRELKHDKAITLIFKRDIIIFSLKLF